MSMALQMASRHAIRSGVIFRSAGRAERSASVLYRNSSPSFDGICVRVRSTRHFTSSVSSSVSNGKFLNYAMLYHDSVAFLVSNRLGIPVFMASDDFSGKTPTQVAKAFNLSVRSASALLVTLCRMDVVQIQQDSDESVDDIIYELTPAAQTFLLLGQG